MHHSYTHLNGNVLVLFTSLSEQCGVSSLMRLLASLVCQGKVYLIGELIGQTTWERQRNAHRGDNHNFFLEGINSIEERAHVLLTIIMMVSY